ncbi:restriction endonuclease [Austwickia chelonae]|uniref:restriction endonuclease n=1 Tax=Austwickia chelonae TaxID=100225 RepID=UPI000E2389A0|nr:restriction endonuclease [Austwickia chelonae]
MTIPDFQTCMRPCLAMLAERGRMRSREVKNAIADVFNLADEERARLLTSGRQRMIDNRVAWALTYLTQAGLLSRPQRGYVEITDAGRQALAANPDRIDRKTLEAFPAYRTFRERARDTAPAVADLPGGVESAATPEELSAAAVKENQNSLEGGVLDRALALSPIGFEDLVIALLARMGYGRAGSVERTSATGDAGVDGIISQDPLGLDRIYVQAKRYATDRVIDRPRIHEFAGALLGKQGDRGVYITTSRFSSGARQEADRINARIELIDGARLAELLVQYKVGVQTDQTFELLRMDEDFFDTL